MSCICVGEGNVRVASAVTSSLCSGGIKTISLRYVTSVAFDGGGLNAEGTGFLLNSIAIKIDMIPVITIVAMRMIVIIFILFPFIG